MNNHYNIAHARTCTPKSSCCMLIHVTALPVVDSTKQHKEATWMLEVVANHKLLIYVVMLVSFCMLKLSLLLMMVHTSAKGRV